jgi:hypothetical protein
MKRLLFLSCAAVLPLLAACSKSDSSGSGVSSTVSAETLVSSPNSYVGKTITVTGVDCMKQNEAIICVHIPRSRGASLRIAGSPKAGGASACEGRTCGYDITMKFVSFLNKGNGITVTAEDIELFNKGRGKL